MNCRKRQWMTVVIRLILSQVSYLKRLSGLSNAAQRGGDPHPGALPLLHICGRQRAVECSVAEEVSLAGPHSAIACVAAPCGICQHGLENRLQVTRRTGDDL